MAPTARLVAILPCNDLDRSEAFYARLGFSRGPGQEAWQQAYRILSRPDGTQLHLRRAEPGWLPPERNPFGLYLYTEEVAALAAGLRAEIIGGDGPVETAWGTLEFALSDPDGTLVRIGQPVPEKS
ncbi:VOC family protein [Methylorubrum zatmanii]|uniref:VOC family protein n=1 Tax=Methylorubrum zatmanii TaxID=29429 RepID=A0ABW1WN47_9HYPH|nr:VOC family protein [Methylorubrum zatmanii]MBD8906993.1 glyoxalase [Methylorubrum zatmanii]